MKKQIFAILLICIFAVGAVVWAQNGNKGGDQSFGYELVKDSSGDVKVKITSFTPGKGMWLGVTVYPPNVKNVAKEAKTYVFPLKKGNGIQEITLDPAFLNGTFEAAIWNKKLSKSECPAGDFACQQTGYRLLGMKTYVWGYLVSTP